MSSSKYRSITRIFPCIFLIFDLANTGAMEIQNAKNPEENLTLFEGDIIPRYDEIRDDYSKKLAKKLVKKGILKPETNHENYEGDSFVALGGAQTNHRWEDRKDDVIQVPYTFQSGSFSSSEMSTIEKAIKKLEEDAGVIKFVKRTNEKNYILVLNDQGCYSYVGNIKIGPQRLSLQRNGCVYQGIIQHEFIHALGFYHEQSRSDRDKYVTIHSNNIISRAIDNFQKRNDVNSLGSDYDFGSIMHYGRTDFTSNGRATITSKNGESFGQREGPSKSDIEQIRLLYQCKSGPRTLTKYEANMCTSDCPCWLGASGCNEDSACQGSMVCKNNKCVKGSTTGGGDCKDKYGNCPFWAGKGFCDKNGYTEYMGETCKKSCDKCSTPQPTPSPTPSPTVTKTGNCTDGYTNCAGWARSGYCTGRYEDFMSQNCKKSCDLCGTSSCKDNNRNCPNWAGLNYCNEKYVAYMRQNCKKSCELC